MAKGKKFPNPNLNESLEEVFDTDTGHRHDGTDSRLTAYSTVKAGVQGFLATTCTVALASIAATDVVIAQVTAYATSAYVTKVVITAGTGFIATLNTSPGNATISYLVFNNS